MKEYMSIPEAAVLWKTFPYILRCECENHKILGAVRFGKRWLIPSDADRPSDILPYAPVM